MFTKHKTAQVFASEFNKVEKKKLCYCQITKPTLYVARLFGMFPVAIHHEGDKCIFVKSNLWICYSVSLICAYVVQIVTSTNFFHFSKIKSLPVLLSEITDTIYGVYVVILTILNFYRFPRWIKTLNKVVDILNYGIFCQSAMRTAYVTQFFYIITFFAIFCIRFGLLIFLHFSQDFSSDFDYKVVINKFMQQITFIFYQVILMKLSVFIGISACFEKLTTNALSCNPVHPLKGITSSNNEQDVMGIFRYKLCQHPHNLTGKLFMVAKMSRVEVIEFLRILHENISLIIYDMNECINPQFLFHTVVELTVLVIQWYAVIVYLAYEFRAPMARTVHLTNCLFVVVHTMGIFMFLKNAQLLKNMIQGLSNFLLETATRITNPEEHQQMRLFIEKLKQHRPLTASGVFNIDLGIAGPISANILTYVLVALQFNIPKEE